MQTSKVFDDTLILNFGSRYAGWTDDVRLLLTQLSTWDEGYFPAIPQQKLSNRLNEIKYICLVGRLAITETRKVFPVISGRESGNRDENENDLEGLLARMQDAPEHDEEECKKDVSEVEEDFPWSSNVDVEDDHGISSEFPHHGGTKEGKEVSVIVDCYGIYVRSLKEWLDGLSNQYSNRTMNQWKQRLADRSSDGPAILLCPELIETIYRSVMRRASLPIRKTLMLDVNPSRLFLKLTLLHEIGHHVFPICADKPTRYLSEAMANWFVYCIVSPQERALLHEKTQTQTRPYQMYQGMLPLLYPSESSLFGMMLSPWFYLVAQNFTQWFEEMAFDGQLGNSVLNEPEWLDFILHYDFIKELLHIPPIRHYLDRFPYRAGVHPIQVMSWMLLDEAVFDRRVEISRVLHRIEKYSRHNWRPMSRARQQQWLEKMWKQPRILDKS